MRADFWGDCAVYPDLVHLMEAHQKLIGPMNSAELRSAMEQQARLVGLRFEADLSQTILDDVQDEPGAMPLLQHALLELWQRRHGRWLRAEEYRAIGGVQRAIAETAEKIYKQVFPAEQASMRDIFIRLTRLDEMALPGEERRDTRRRAPLKELIPAGGDPVPVKKLVQRLADARLVVTGVNAVSGLEEVEVAHEALIRYWPRLRQWLNENRDILRLREGIRQAAQEWQAHPAEDSLLIHRGTRLEEIETLRRLDRLSLNEQEQAYLDACVHLREAEQAEKERQQQERLAAAEKLATEQQRRIEVGRRYLVGVVILLLLAIGAAVFAINRQAEAEQRARLARAAQLAAQAQAAPPNLTSRSLLLALEALNVSQAGDPYQPAPSQALREALQKPLGYPLPGHESFVTAMAFSPDGQWLATASSDTTARLWSLADPQTEPWVLRGHEDRVTAVAFSPDGQWLATASEDITARLRSLADPLAEPLVLRGHEDRVTAVAFSPDGQWLATASTPNPGQGKPRSCRPA